MTDQEHRPGSNINPHSLQTFRSELAKGEDVIDPVSWAGSVPQARNRPSDPDRQQQVVQLAVAASDRSSPAPHRCCGGAGPPRDAVGRAVPATPPGTVEPAGAEADAGFPAWVGWQHFFNLFLMIFIIRSATQILSDYPRLYWTRHSTPGKDWFRIQKPVPSDPLWTAKKDSISLPGQVGLPGIRHSTGLARWWHLGVDTLWLLKGVVFYILLFATGQWRRLVPMTWEVFPNALSVMIQYLSLDWSPRTDGCTTTVCS